MSDKTYSNAEFGAIIAKNTQWSDANAKWVKERLIDNSRLLPDHGSKCLRSALRIICLSWRS